MTSRQAYFNDSALSLPIPRTALEVANEFAQQQPFSPKAEQVRLNTLAVWVVNDYLTLMGIPTDLNAGESWNPVMRLCADVADLMIPGVGRLECRPLVQDAASQSATTCPIPPEVWCDRVGYVVVAIADSQQQATLLGFTETASVEALPLRQLRPLEDLLDHLDPLLHPVSVVQMPLIQLHQWVEGIFERGWQMVDTLLSPAQLNPGFAFRNRSSAVEEPAIRRAKRLDLGLQACILVVNLIPESQTRSRIHLQVYPADGMTSLPANLQLQVLDDTGAVFLTTQTQNPDEMLQLQFSGERFERFEIALMVEAATVREAFVI